MNRKGCVACFASRGTIASKLYLIAITRLSLYQPSPIPTRYPTNRTGRHDTVPTGCGASALEEQPPAAGVVGCQPSGRQECAWRARVIRKLPPTPAIRRRVPRPLPTRTEHSSLVHSPPLLQVPTGRKTAGSTQRQTENLEPPLPRIHPIIHSPSRRPFFPPP